MLMENKKTLYFQGFLKQKCQRRESNTGGLFASSIIVSKPLTVVTGIASAKGSEAKALLRERVTGPTEAAG